MCNSVKRNMPAHLALLHPPLVAFSLHLMTRYAFTLIARHTVGPPPLFRYRHRIHFAYSEEVLCVVCLYVPRTLCKVMNGMGKAPISQLAPL